MSDQTNNETPDNGSKKISLAEAVRQKLAQKKQTQQDAPNGVENHDVGNKKMKSQMTKKVNNQHRRTGGS